MDIQGHLVHVNVHAANLYDTLARSRIFEVALQAYPGLKDVCADGGYHKPFKDFVKNSLRKR